MPPRAGKHFWCTSCNIENPEEWKLKSKNLNSSKFDKFYSTIHGRAVHMHNNAKARAIKKTVSFMLTVEWVEARLIAGVCEVTRIPFELKGNNGKGHKENSFSPSIDRIDQTGPYTPENCQMTCWIYNRAKGAFPLEDLQRMLEALNKKPTVLRWAGDFQCPMKFNRVNLLSLSRWSPHPTLCHHTKA
jgi:hypothetical protein